MSSQVISGNNLAAAPRSQSLTIQAGALLTGKVVGFAFTFLIPIVLSRVLTLTQFGHYKQLFLVITMSQAILPLGFGVSTFYFFSRESDPAKRRSVAANALLFHICAGILGAAVLFLWPNSLTKMFGSADLVPYAGVLSLVLLLSVAGSLIESIATANQDVMFSTVFIISAQLTRAVAMIAGALWTRSLAGLLYAALFQAVIQIGFLIYYLELRFPGFWKMIDLPMLRWQLGYTLPLGFAGLIFTLQINLHNYFVSNLFGPALFAVYSVGVAQLPLIGLIRESVSAVLLGRVSRLQKEGRRRDILLLTIHAMRKMALVYWPLYGLLMILARELIVLMYTDRFLSSVPVLRINLALLPFLVIMQDPILRAYAEYRYYLLALRVVLLTASLIVLITTLRSIGLVGAISVVVGFAFVERAIILSKVSRVLGMSRQDLPRFWPLARIAGAVAIASIVGILVRWTMLAQKPFVILVVTGTAYMAVYVGIVLLWGLLDDDERNLLRHSWNRALQFSKIARANAG